MKRIVFFLTTIVFASIFIGWVDRMEEILIPEKFSQLKNGAWSQLANLQTARGLHSVGAVNGKIYAIGGNQLQNSSVEEYEPGTDIWTHKSPMPTGRGDFSCCVVNEKIYAIGGWVDNMTFSN
jgi:N-acetylneuraminic acid mutarotase